MLDEKQEESMTMYVLKCLFAICAFTVCSVSFLVAAAMNGWR